MDTIETCGKTFQIKAKYIKTIDKFPNSDTGESHNQFMISVWHGKEKVSFMFYGSVRDYEQGIKKLPKSDLRQAFKCLIEDAIAGAYTFHDFCCEMGYDEDSRRAERIFKACQRQVKKTLKLGLNMDNLYDIINDLNETGES